MEGSIAIVIGLTDHSVEHRFADQLSGKIKMNDIPTSTVESGRFFGWSALIPPYHSNAGAKAIKSSHGVVFNCDELRDIIQKDLYFGYLMTLKVAQVIRERLRAMRVDLLAAYAK